jgi:glyoxylase-like metal-dependent hydrolase (beta-lactamase superfamily II)
MQNYVYLLGDPHTHEAAVVDAAWDIDAIVQTAEADGYRITKDLVTHFHPDHLGGDLMGHQINGAAELISRVPAKVHIHKAELPFVQHLTGLSASDVVPVEGGDDVEVGKLRVKMIHTPGHTPGHQSLLVKLAKTGAVLLSGDAVHFKDNWDNRRVPEGNTSKDQTVASLQRMADVLAQEKAQLWINHDKAQRDTLKMAPEFYD